MHADGRPYKTFPIRNSSRRPWNSLALINECTVCHCTSIQHASVGTFRRTDCSVRTVPPFSLSIYHENKYENNRKQANESKIEENNNKVLEEEASATTTGDRGGGIITNKPLCVEELKQQQRQRRQPLSSNVTAVI